MSALNNSLLLGQEGGGGYAISRSLRFNSSDSAYLSRTPASAGNRKTWTWAGWVKRSKLADYQRFFWATGECSIRFENDDTLRFSNYTGIFTAFFKTTAVYRDTSAWYHIVLVADTTNATASDRIRLYVNGNRVTSFSSQTNPSQNLDLEINATTAHNIGGAGGSEYFSGYLADIHFIDGQALTPSSFGEFSATTGVWMPKQYTGTYGTNGFKLNFSDNSTTAALGTDTSGNGNTWTVNNLAVGGAQPALYSSPNLYTNAADVIANGTPLSSGSTFSSVYVYLVTNGGGDVGSKVFTADGSGTIGANWTWLHRIGSSWVASGGYNNSEWDLFTWGSQTVATNYIMNNSAPLHMLVDTNNSPQQVSGTIATFNSTPNSGAGNDSLVDVPTNGSEVDTAAGGQVRGNYATLNPLNKGSQATLLNGNLEFSHVGDTVSCRVVSTIAMSSGKWYCEYTPTTTTQLDNVGIALASESASINYLGGTANSYSYYAVNGQKYTNGSQAVYGATYTNGDVIGIAFDADAGTLTFYKNGTSQGTAFTGITAGSYVFGQGNYTGPTYTGVFNFGQRPFTYPVSGFKALNTANLPAPVVTKPNTVFDTVLWTGNDTGQTITMPGAFSPDLVWTKMRSTANNHWLFDVIRGADQGLSSSSTTNELTRSSSVTAFGSTGFTLGTSADVNSSAYTYAAWCWDAGSSTVTNTAGSISSQVRANASAGFSVITWTGGSAGTVGHGLGVTPAFVITKSRTNGVSWRIWHRSFSSLANYLGFDSGSVGTFGSGNYWQNPTSTTIGFTGGYDNNVGNMVAYCFAPVAGYSAFGSYTGNGSTDGPFVYTGMRPRWIMFKCSSTNNGYTFWEMIDTARPNNLAADLSDAEGSYNLGTGLGVDILSNGFKIRGAGSGKNISSQTYIYAAFAESPFQYARAR